ncbi:HAD family hydrolase [Bacillus sp. ISL-41]|uniref:HAD family hydrolase n=1 Tax=Bacillus sp. ISL-41 TaxID=2819127 RepID=UPI001BE54D0C|nr:HAD-IA family hydrolase [Bacillus sp. ISL-41]MBT2642212.1 HAD family hydrolase [Bacillus sp. ISL-41]
MESNLLDQYEIIIFDCDGVLIDINELKCEAFGKAVEGYDTDIVEKFVYHCRNSFGISRYVKFKEFFSDFLNEPYNEEIYKDLVSKYSNICKDFYMSAKITPGTEKLLSEISLKNKYLYIASGSDEIELKEVFSIRNLKKYFSGIYGSPKSKSECTSIVLNNHPGKKAVFIGDSLADLKTAREYQIEFIYMTNFTIQSYDRDQLCRDGATKIIKTLEELIQC